MNAMAHVCTPSIDDKAPSLSFSCGSWIYNSLCNQCIWTLTLWVRISLIDTVCQWLAAGRWFSPSILVSSTNNANRHDITGILLKVELNIKSLCMTVIITIIQILSFIQTNSHPKSIQLCMFTNYIYVSSMIKRRVLKIQKGWSESVNQKRTDNTMAKRKRY